MDDESAPHPSRVTPEQRVAFEVESRNGFILLKLDDGAVLSLRVMVNDVWKMEGMSPQGEPQYNIASQTAVVLMRSPRGSSDLQ
jgi:hypothetical protein